MGNDIDHTHLLYTDHGKIFVNDILQVLLRKKKSTFYM